MTATTPTVTNPFRHSGAPAVVQREHEYVYLNVGLSNPAGPPHRSADVFEDLAALGLFPAFLGSILGGDRVPIAIFVVQRWPSEAAVDVVCRKYGQRALLAYCPITQRRDVLGPGARSESFDPSRFFLSADPGHRLAPEAPAAAS